MFGTFADFAPAHGPENEKGGDTIAAVFLSHFFG
jgi:hypothetical protein